MSKARDEYYKWLARSNKDFIEPLRYVKELEQRCGQYHDLVEIRTIRLNELEQQKAELIEFACNNCIGICYHDECKIYKLKNT